MRALALAITAALTLSACAHPLATTATRTGATAAKAHRSLAASVLRPEQVSAGLIAQVLPAAQKTADDASRKRKIDFFQLHDAPVGIRLGAGADAAHVLSFLGTSKNRNDLNIELRALIASGQLAVSHNYSGPVTLGKATRPAIAPRRGGLSFELLMGIPGDGVDEAYEDYMNHLGDRLAQQYQARPFAWDDAPLIFAVHDGDAVPAFVFTNQGNRLVLGDRKYADVQNVVVVSDEAEVLAAYTLIGFNPKTTGADGRIDYRFEEADRFGTLVEFGEL